MFFTICFQRLFLDFSPGPGRFPRNSLALFLVFQTIFQAFLTSSERFFFTGFFPKSLYLRTLSLFFFFLSKVSPLFSFFLSTFPIQFLDFRLLSLFLNLFILFFYFISFSCENPPPLDPVKAYSENINFIKFRN